jgi:hypothetical protein
VRHTFHAPPCIPCLHTELGWREPRAQKGRRGAPTGGTQAGAMQQEGAGACKLPFACPCPLCTSPIALHAKGERWGALGRGCHVSHVAVHPCALFENGGGGGVPHRPAPVPRRGANERPLFAHERGRAKGVGGGGSTLPVLCKSWGLGPKGGGQTFRALPCVPHLCTEAGWREPCAWREGKQGGGHQQGISGGPRTGGAMRHQGGLFAPLPPCTPPCVCISRKEGRSLPAQEEGRVGVHPSHTAETHCCLCVVLLCFIYFNFVFSLKYK